MQCMPCMHGEYAPATRPTYSPAIGYFHDKKRISKAKFQLIYCLLLNYCTRQCTLLSPTWALSLTKFNPKMQDFKRVMGLNCK